jgi:hypothetical protein
VLGSICIPICTPVLLTKIHRGLTKEKSIFGQSTMDFRLALEPQKLFFLRRTAQDFLAELLSIFGHLFGDNLAQLTMKRSPFRDHLNGSRLTIFGQSMMDFRSNLGPSKIGLFCRFCIKTLIIHLETILAQLTKKESSFGDNLTRLTTLI